ncbi:MAG TPA: hypothetical protein VEZ24_16620, partial [Microvirga sp.]|nr:hypothetical protein [Microvirga sp.]
YGTDIRGPIEWLAAVTSVNSFLDDIEDHYERGAGNIALPQAGRRQFCTCGSKAAVTFKAYCTPNITRTTIKVIEPPGSSINCRSRPTRMGCCCRAQIACCRAEDEAHQP